MIIDVLRKILLCGFVVSFASCDSGNIYPDTGDASDGRTVKFTVKFTNVDQWPDENRYRVCFACYKDGSTVPTTYHDISRPTEGQEMTYTFKNLSSDITTFAVSLTRISHSHVYNIYSEKIPGSDSKVITVDNMQLKSVFSLVQSDIFDARCISCHGDGRTSAKLDLREGKSYDMLVGQTAVTDPTRTRVVKSNADSSYIVDMLTDAELPANAKGYTNHPTTVMVSDDMMSLLKDWINSGAGK